MSLPLFLFLLLAQTMPEARQIKDPNQVQMCSATPSTTTTKVSGCQVRGGRYVAKDAQGLPTICVLSWVFVGPDEYIGPACYSQAGLAKLLADPLWLVWWNAQPK